MLSPRRTRLADDLRKNIQQSIDRHNAGVQVTAVNLPMLRPSGSSAPSFEELNVSVQARRQRIAQVRRDVFNRLTFYLGNAAIVDQVLAAINEYDRLKAELGADAEQAILQRQHTVDLLVAGAGMAAQEIDNAKTDRWITLMSKRAQADRVQSQLAAYRAAPELYRQRETMKVYKQWLPVMDKYIIAIDPSQVGIDVDLKKISSLHEFAGASEEEKKQQ